MENIIPSTDNTVIERMMEEGTPIPVFGYEEFLKLPTTEAYDKNPARLARIERESKGIFDILRVVEDEKVNDEQGVDECKETTEQ